MDVLKVAAISGICATTAVSPLNTIRLRQSVHLLFQRPNKNNNGAGSVIFLPSDRPLSLFAGNLANCLKFVPQNLIWNISLNVTEQLLVTYLMSSEQQRQWDLAMRRRAHERRQRRRQQQQQQQPGGFNDEQEINNLIRDVRGRMSRGEQVTNEYILERIQVIRERRAAAALTQQPQQQVVGDEIENDNEEEDYDYYEDSEEDLVDEDEIEEEEEAQEAMLPLHLKLIAGTISGFIKNLLTYPLDLISTRLTVQRKHAGLKRLYLSTSNAFQRIVANEGGFFRGLFRGVGVSIITGLPFDLASSLAHYCFIPRWLRYEYPFYAGCLSNLFAQSVTYPAQLLYTYAKVQPMFADEEVARRGMLDTARFIYEQEGVRGFYAGFWVNVAKVVAFAVVVDFVWNTLSPRRRRRRSTSRRSTSSSRRGREAQGSGADGGGGGGGGGSNAAAV